MLLESANRKYLVEKIRITLRDHYAEKISLDRIAGNMYLSTFLCPRIFKAETGNTPIHYLIDIRLTKAYNLLTQNLEMSIQEIAAQVGYEDAYHFSKLFKKKIWGGSGLQCGAGYHKSSRIRPFG